MRQGVPLQPKLERWHNTSLKKIHTERIIKRDNSIKPWYIHMNEIQGSARYTVLKVGYSA